MALRFFIFCSYLPSLSVPCRIRFLTVDVLEAGSEKRFTLRGKSWAPDSALQGTHCQYPPAVPLSVFLQPSPVCFFGIFTFMHLVCLSFSLSIMTPGPHVCIEGMSMAIHLWLGPQSGCFRKCPLNLVPLAVNLAKTGAFCACLWFLVHLLSSLGLSTLAVGH